MTRAGRPQVQSEHVPSAGAAMRTSARLALIQNLKSRNSYWPRGCANNLKGQVVRLMIQKGSYILPM